MCVFLIVVILKKIFHIVINFLSGEWKKNDQVRALYSIYVSDSKLTMMSYIS